LSAADIRVAWLLQIARDDAVPDRVYKIAYFIAPRINRKTNEVWPAADKIAQRLGWRRTGVADAIALLVSRGYLVELSQAGLARL
jgi:hypothetical protein